MTDLGTAGGARRVRCAELAREVGADPRGTAPTFAGVLLVEQPRPWPRDAAEAPILAQVVDLARTAGVRLQLVAPRGDARPDAVRLIAYRMAHGDGFAGYRGRELWAEPNSVLDTAARLLAEPTESWTPPGQGVVDVLICTHGSRDTCCGGSGTRAAMAAMAALDEPGRVRVWSTSHLGGHRFAPTALVLPTGTMWANADARLLDAVVRRSLPAAAVIDRFRGCTGTPAGAVQAVEGAVLAEVGWSLLDSERMWLSASDRVSLAVRGAAGVSRWEANVVPGRRVPTPPCGAQPSVGDVAEAQEIAVGNLRRMA